MRTYDPRILIRAFDILNEELQRFNHVLLDTFKQVENTQKYSQERVNQTNKRVAIALNDAKSDLESVEEIDTDIRQLLGNSSTAIETAHQTVDMVVQARQQAEMTLQHWQDELHIALAWQARAEVRLERAVQEYQRAQQNLESAQRNLESAELNLRRCRNDSERKSCSGEERAYNNARIAVAEAIEVLQIAEIEVRAAQEDLSRAKARVACCQKAVSYALQAIQHAKLAEEQSNQALNEAERSLESAESANRAIAKAITKANEEHQFAEQAASQVRQAETFVNQAQFSIRTARNKADSAYNLATRGKQELQFRKKLLILFNQTEFGLSRTSSIRSNSPSLNTPEQTIANSLAESLQYEDRYNYLEEENGSAQIIAKDLNRQEVGYLNIQRTSSNRIKIKDTGVPDKLQGKGIGSSLLSNLEQRLPKGTELYFEENQAPEFWAKKGFQQRIKQDGTTEFFKVIK